MRCDFLAIAHNSCATSGGLTRGRRIHLAAYLAVQDIKKGGVMRRIIALICVVAGAIATPRGAGGRTQSRPAAFRISPLPSPA
jgi:hypothetical protein